MAFPYLPVGEKIATRGLIGQNIGPHIPVPPVRNDYPMVEPMSVSRGIRFLATGIGRGATLEIISNGRFATKETRMSLLFGNRSRPVHRSPAQYFHRKHRFLNAPSRHDVDAFLETRSRLKPDRYLDNPANRSRRVAKFVFSHDDKIIRPIADTAFFQKKAVNPLLGGIHRIYERSEATFLGSPVLQDVLDQDCRHVREIDERPSWLITCHQFRIHCRAGESGQPTPGGLHCDKHRFVFQHFIGKSSVVGGQSRICSGNGATLALLTLETVDIYEDA